MSDPMSSQPMPSPPMPVPDASTQFFWEGAAAHRLMILACLDCASFLHPPRPVCPFCGSTAQEPKEVSGQASLYTWTVVERAFHPFFADKVPYVYATVELAEQPGLRMITNVVDCPPEDLHISMPLTVTFREVAPELTLPLFRPALPESASQSAMKPRT